MKPELGDSENVFLFGIDVNVVGRTGKRRCLNERANRSGIVSLYIAFVSRAKALDLPVIPGELSTTSPNVDRVASDEFFRVRILQVLPARHPANGGVSNVVRSGWLNQQVRQVSGAGVAVQVVAQIAANLPAGVCNPGGPVPGL